MNKQDVASIVIGFLQGAILASLLVWLGLTGIMLWVIFFAILIPIVAIEVFLIFPKLFKEVKEDGTE